MLYTKFDENRIKGKGTVTKKLKRSFDLGMTLTFDLLKIQWDVMNAQTLKHIHTKFGEAKYDSLWDPAVDGGTDGRTRDISSVIFL